MKINRKFIIILCLFIIFQPLLDVSIYYINKILNIQSILIPLIRPLIGGTVFLILLFNKNISNKEKFAYLGILGIYGIYCIIHLFNIKGYYFNESDGNLLVELRYLATCGYFLLMFINMFLVFKYSDEISRNKLIKSIILAGTLICTLYFLSILTNTSPPTYMISAIKNGYKGWSISTHYIGHTTILIMPIALYYCYNKLIFKNNILNILIPIILVIPGFYLIGTKAPAYLLLVIFTTYCLFNIIYLFRKTEKIKVINIIAPIVILITLFLTLNTTYAYKNMQHQIDISQRPEQQLHFIEEKEETEVLKFGVFEKRLRKALKDNSVASGVFDNRQVQFQLNYDIFRESPIKDKLFGWGYTTMSRNSWVETETFSLLFSFGIIAPLIILIPFIIVGARGLLTLIDIKEMNFKKWFFGVSFAISFGLITIVGYALYFAQTNFYLAFLLVICFNSFFSEKKIKNNHKKKYLFMINDMTTGGAEVGLVDVINELVKKDNVEVDLLLLRKRGELLDRIDSKVNILSLYQAGNNVFYKFTNLFIKILYFGSNATNKLLYSIIIDKKYTAEIAYIEGYPAIFLSNSTNKDSIKIASIRVGLKNHKLHIEKIPNGLKRLEKAYQKMDYIHCVSKETANEFMERFPGNDDKIQVYYTYFNISEINKKGKAIINDFDKNKFNIVAVGRFDEQKGYERLITAIKNIDKKDINLYFIGKNNSLYGNKMKELVNKYQLSNIYFLGVKTNPYPYIKQADILVSSSHYEGYPRVINEALCLKQICVATNVTGTKEALQDGKLGLLVDNSVEGIEKGILKVYNNDKILIDIKKNINIFDGNKKQFFEGLDYMTYKTNNLRCLFITDIYPYNGEGFVNNEIKYASKIFKNIDIITTNPNSKEYAYDLPANVKVYHLNKLNLLYLFSNLDFQKEAFKEFFKSIKNKRRFIIWGKNYYFSAVTKAKIIKLLKRNNYDVFFSYWFHWSSLAITRMNYPALKIAKSHGYDLYEAANPQLYKKYILERISNVYPISKAGYDELKMQTGMENIKLYFLGTYNNNILDFSKFKNEKEINIVSVSRMAPVKRIHLIIEILAFLDLKINWIHFGDGELMPEIKNLASEKLDKKRNITYELKGYVRNDEILNYYNNNYQNIDLFINTSSQEGIPVTIMESISYGIVPLAGDVGGNREIVTKYLVKNGLDEKTIIEEMIKIINNYAKMSLKEKIDLKKEVYNIWNKKFNANINNRKFYMNEILNKLK